MDYVDQEPFKNVQCPSAVSTKPVTVLWGNQGLQQIVLYLFSSDLHLAPSDLWDLIPMKASDCNAVNPPALTDNVLFVCGHEYSCISCMH